jgi:hypothetical protein|tara:strand:+ start:572 stop:1072 length:501 start_codon:yes stop_codon:yes gene_type:complete
MKNEIWFEAAASTGMRIPANYYPTSPPYMPNVPSVPTRPVDPVTQTVMCNKCNSGYPVSNIFPGTLCPTGWTTDKDPCTIVKGPPVLVDPIGDVVVPVPVLDDLPLEEPQLPIYPDLAGGMPDVPTYTEPTPVVVVNPQPVEVKKDNNDLILYIAIGVGVYLLLKK